MNRFKSYAFQSILMVLTFVACGQHSRANEPDRDEFKSYLQAMKANWDSIKQFDLLQRTDYTHESVISGGYVETLFERLIFDWDNERFLYVKRGNRKRIADDAIEFIASGFILDRDSARSFELPVRDAKAEHITSEQDRHILFDRHRVPDFYLTTFMKYGTDPKPWSEKERTLYTVYPGIAKEVKKTSQTSDHTNFFVRFEHGSANRWKFGTTNLMPTSGEWLSISGNNKYRPLAQDKYEWIDFDGITVPDVVIGEYTQAEVPKGIEMSEESVREHMRLALIRRDIQFAWISVNQNIETSTFDFKQLDSVSKFLSLTDPVEQGVPMLSDLVEAEQISSLPADK